MYISAPNKSNTRSIPLWHQADFNLIRDTISNYSNYFFNKHTLATPVNVLWENYKSLRDNCLSLVPHSQTTDKYVSFSLDYKTNQKIVETKKNVNVTLLPLQTLLRIGKVIIT